MIQKISKIIFLFGVGLCYLGFGQWLLPTSRVLYTETVIESSGTVERIRIQDSVEVVVKRNRSFGEKILRAPYALSKSFFGLVRKNFSLGSKLFVVFIFTCFVVLILRRWDKKDESKIFVSDSSDYIDWYNGNEYW